MRTTFPFLLVLVLLISSCAQIGSLSGGSKDEYAPKLVKELSDSSGQRNFEQKEIQLTFDEFFTLNDPSQNLFSVPGGLNFSTKIHSKKLLITWQEDPAPNTTYVIYLNGLVKDITEGNDSLMQFVFSTGPIIDSLHTTFMVRDAITNQPIRNATVGLFASDTSNLPFYFTRSNEKGYALLTHLKEGSYVARAFLDVNKDRSPQETEKQGFKNELAQINENSIDTTIITCFEPTPSKLIKSFLYAPPASFILTSTFDLKQATLRLNGNTLRANQLQVHRPDSIQIFPDLMSASDWNLEVKSNDKIDSTHLRILANEKDVPNKYVFNGNAPNMVPSAPLLFSIQDVIRSVNEKSIQVFSLKDSSAVPFSIQTVLNTLTIQLDRSNLSGVRIILPANAVQGMHHSIAGDLDQVVTFRMDRELGILNAKIIGGNSKGLIELYQQGKCIARKRSEGNERVTFPELLPGEYQFRYIEDSDKNERWTTGSYTNRIQPEKIYNFPQQLKVRANWEMDVPLKLSDD